MTNCTNDIRFRIDSSDGGLYERPHESCWYYVNTEGYLIQSKKVKIIFEIDEEGALYAREESGGPGTCKSMVENISMNDQGELYLKALRIVD